MITAHVDATDSAVGQRVLADWPGEQKHFVKVMPRDYKRVLGAIAEAEAAGEDVRRSDHGGRPWLIRAASSSTPIARPRPAGRSPLRLRDWKEVYEDFSHDEPRRSRRRGAWTAVSRSATTGVRWAI